MGVSGSGKSTVGSLLATEMGWAFADGDDLHPAANVAKMRAGQPLDDADRQPWLAAVGDWIDGRAAAGEPAVVACSALRRRYRDRLRGGRPQLLLVYLAVDRATAARRLTGRGDHFFPPQLLESQFLALEEPEADEEAIVVRGEGLSWSVPLLLAGLRNRGVAC